MCSPLHPLKCAGDIGSNLAGSAVQQFVQSLADGCKTALAYVSSFWMKVPSPDVASGSGQSWHEAGTVSLLQGSLMPITAAVCLISFMFALLRISFSPERAGEGMKSILRQMVAVICATLPAAVITQVLIEFGDQFSPWIIQQAAGQSASEGFQKILINGMFPDQGGFSSGLGLYLVIFLLAIIGAAAQCVFMVLRGAMIFILLVMLPPVAAGSATEEGWQRYKKMLMGILGFALYKPVAAIIYATGFKLMSQNDGDQVQNAIYGLTVITMAAIALPAMIKFVMPMAAVGSSSAFSGGALIGTAAAGAAVVSLGVATGGAGLAAGGAGSSAGTATAGAAAEGAEKAAAAGGAAGGGSGGGGGAPGGGSGGGTPGGGSGGTPEGADPTPAADGGGAGPDGAEPAGDAGTDSGADGSPQGAPSTAPAASNGNGEAQPAASGSPEGAPQQSSQSGDSGQGSAPPPRPTPSGAPQRAPQPAPQRSRAPQVVSEFTRNVTQQIRDAGDGAADGADR